MEGARHGDNRSDEAGSVLNSGNKGYTGGEPGVGTTDPVATYSKSLSLLFTVTLALVRPHLGQANFPFSA